MEVKDPPKTDNKSVKLPAETHRKREHKRAIRPEAKTIGFISRIPVIEVSSDDDDGGSSNTKTKAEAVARTPIKEVTRVGK